MSQTEDMWDDDTRYAVIRGRDARYDGQFFTAVHTTGIYCRPSCPARTPARQNVSFYRTAAAAQQAGFRSCRRCFPEATPGSPEWKVGEDVASRAMRLIDDGLVEREGVSGLAGRLGYSERQLGRILADEVGAGPLALAIAHRMHHARALLETTALPMVDVAYAAGFGSVRQFNDAARKAWGLSPSHVRGRARTPIPHPGPLTRVELKLRFRAPHDGARTLAFLQPRLIDGIEDITNGTYTRACRLERGPAVLRLMPRTDHIAAVIDLTDPRDTAEAVARSRRLLDLDADPVAIDAALGRDPMLASRVANAPGVRVPSAADAFEMIVRAIAGQQISVAGAIRALAKITATWGDSFSDGDREWRLFPTASALAEVDPSVGIIPRARWGTVSAVARAIVSGELDISAGADRTRAHDVLVGLPGIGPWTASYVLMRAYGDPDAFPAGDLVLRKVTGLNHDDLTARSESWRPWRAYAAMHLWAAPTEGTIS